VGALSNATKINENTFSVGEIHVIKDSKKPKIKKHATTNMK